MKSNRQEPTTLSDILRHLCFPEPSSILKSDQKMYWKASNFISSSPKRVKETEIKLASPVVERIIYKLQLADQEALATGGQF